MIKLFSSDATEFTTNGLGGLPDATKCDVTEERNGSFELELAYPITGLHYSDISQRKIILAKPNPYSDPQAFRIYAISKPINGLVAVNAEHISYDMNGIPVSPFSGSTIQNAFIELKSHSVTSCPFNFSTDRTTEVAFSTTLPMSMRTILGGTQGSFLDVYGGEFEFDNFDVKLYNSRGVNRGVTLRYGKNLTDLKQDENCSNIYTGIYPYWCSKTEESQILVELPEKVISASGTYDYSKIMPLDFSSDFQEQPSVDELRARGVQYMADNFVGVPKVSMTVSFVDMARSTEYENIKLLQTVKLCDTVTVIFPELNVNASSKCVKTVFDALSGTYKSITLGDPHDNIANTIVEQSVVINTKPTKTSMDTAIDNATRLITGGLGGYVVMHGSNGGNKPDEILILDTDNIATAQNVWRWNQNGLGFSSNGYNGPFETAITSDGKIVADFIKGGVIDGSLIKAGSIEASALNIGYSGGINFIHNSGALNGVSDDWVTTGTIIDLESSDTISGYMFQVSNGTMSQDISVIKGQAYTFSLKAKSSTTSICYAKIGNGSKDVYAFNTSDTTNWTDYDVTFIADSDVLTLTIGSEGSYLYISDMIITQGETKQNWYPAPNEIYTANVKIDRRGINITNTINSTNTIIDSEQFAVLSKNEVVLTVNKDWTLLKKTQITDDLTVGKKAKFVPCSDGLDLVILD